MHIKSIATDVFFFFGPHDVKSWHDSKQNKEDMKLKQQGCRPLNIFVNGLLLKYLISVRASAKKNKNKNHTRPTTLGKFHILKSLLIKGMFDTCRKINAKLCVSYKVIGSVTKLQ